MGKPYKKTIFSEFFGKSASSKDFGGDVKYHLEALQIENLMEIQSILV